MLNSFFRFSFCFSSLWHLATLDLVRMHEHVSLVDQMDFAKRKKPKKTGTTAEIGQLFSEFGAAETSPIVHTIAMLWWESEKLLTRLGSKRRASEKPLVEWECLLKIWDKTGLYNHTPAPTWCKLQFVWKQKTSCNTFKSVKIQSSIMGNARWNPPIKEKVKFVLNTFYILFKMFSSPKNFSTPKGTRPPSFPHCAPLAAGFTPSCGCSKAQHNATKHSSF